MCVTIPICGAWRRKSTLSSRVRLATGNVYVLREHGHLWRSRTAPIMLLASFCDVALVASLAAGGFLMSPLPLGLITALARTTLVFTLAMDFIKLADFARLQID